ncbi:MAG: hypothetical protein Q3M24_02135 [Candidatus Electrothrix aestuarii]|uniref:Uncharacterized protein n=1 Tax=Candidatus Electrothrix aestuarii TaxID=3062594 RepID=A0AAU8LXK8_9BACT|nr:hypothetical protein [Candidatus Electrothrix aestuarii]
MPGGIIKNKDQFFSRVAPTADHLPKHNKFIGGQEGARQFGI